MVLAVHRAFKKPERSWALGKNLRIARADEPWLRARASRHAVRVDGTPGAFVLATALDGAHVGVSVAATAGRPWSAVFANDSFAQITGYAVADSIGANL